MPSRLLLKLHRERKVLHAPAALGAGRGRARMRGVLELHERAAGDGEADVGVHAGGGAEACEEGVGLEGLGDAAVGGVVAVDADLVGGAVGKVEGDGGVGRGGADAGEDFADDGGGVDADGVEADGLGLGAGAGEGRGDGRRCPDVW